MMKKTFLTLLFSAILPTMFSSATAAPYQGSRIFWDLTSKKNVFPNGIYGRIIELQDGRLMATCESGGILISFSNDKGTTWSTPIRIVNNVNNIPNCVPDLIQLRDGTIIVAYNPRPAQPYTEDRKFGIRCKRSTDNGVSWSDEIFVNDAQHTFDDGCWEPSMLELPSGELQLYFADEGLYTTSNEQQISLCRSFDGGQTWSAPQKISFRAGYRDGMPSPVLLKDKSNIVVAIEDNGWEGIGDFFPTTVRCSLADNWGNSYFVDANSQNRQKTHSVTAGKGGAPYLRVLPWGETVLSWQSKYNHGDNYNMMTAVGDANAENFKALSNPFNISSSESAMWNSVAVIDTGVVVAVASINQGIQMIKGYPMQQFEATYGTPTVDGKITLKEGYTQKVADQVKMGSKTGTRSTADFAYDKSNLYFVAKVIDRTAYSGASGDVVQLLIDTNEEPTDRLGATSFCFKFCRDGNVKMYQGNNGTWKLLGNANITLKATSSSTSYTIEAAIPWNTLGITTVPEDKRMSVDIEIQDKQSETAILTEDIPDTQRSKPSTWMQFYIHKKDSTTDVRNVKVDNSNTLHVNIKDSWLAISANQDLKKVNVYSAAGMLITTQSANDSHLNIPITNDGLLLVKTILADGTTIVKKILAQK